MKIFNPFVGWVEFVDEPTRIVSLCPSVTETLFMLGAGDRVVGVSSWCHRPREALSKPRVGSYVEVLFDKLDELRPQLIITTTGAQREALEKIVSKGYPCYPIPFPNDVYNILSAVVEVGGLVGRYGEALSLSAQLAEYLHQLRRLKTERRKPTVYVEIDLGGPTIPAYFSHITSALHLAGLENIHANIPRRYLYGMKVRDYDVLDVVDEVRRWNPDVIVYESKSFYPARDEGLTVMLSRGLGDVEAVRSGRVLTLPADTLAHYGPSFLAEAVKTCEKIWSLF